MILLDTHLVIWLAGDPERISRTAHLAILEARRADSGLCISDITLWEISMLVSRGHVTAKVTLESFLREVEQSFTVIPVNAAIAMRSTGFSERYPKDPTDRIIGATALVEGLPLVTRDEKIRSSKEVPVIW